MTRSASPPPGRPLAPLGGSWFSNSVALLADLIHNFGDALTAVPLGIAFLRSAAARRSVASVS